MILGQPEQQMHQGRRHMHGGVHRHAGLGNSSYILKGIHKIRSLGMKGDRWSHLGRPGRSHNLLKFFPNKIVNGKVRDCKKYGLGIRKFLLQVGDMACDMRNPT